MNNFPLQERNEHREAAVTTVSFAVPRNSMAFWKERFVQLM